MRGYQTISIDHERINKDIEQKVVTSQEIYARGQKFLDALAHTEFEILESQKIINGLPTQFLIGGENFRLVKEKIYKLASDIKLGNYVGNGEFYVQIPNK